MTFTATNQNTNEQNREQNIEPDKYSKRNQQRSGQVEPTSGMQERTSPKICYFCGGSYPHEGSPVVSSIRKSCNNCKQLNQFSKCCRSVHEVENNTVESDTSSSGSSDDYGTHTHTHN